MEKKFIMLIGISGSGKSTYIKKHFKPETVINADNIRKEFTGDISNHSMDAVIWKKVIPKRINKSLNLNDVAVLDGVNVKSRERKMILKLFPDSKKVAIVFQSNPEISKMRIKNDLKNNIDRSNVPDGKIDKQYKDFMLGYKNIEKQFDEVIYVDTVSNQSTKNESLQIVRRNLMKLYENEIDGTESIESNINPESAKKSINDEFKVNIYAKNQLDKVLEKVNKNLKSRGLKELQLKILHEELVKVSRINKPEYNGELETHYTTTIPIFTVKIEGEVPEIHDFEFIAKIEHTPAGNILNINPNSSIKNLPAEYKTFNQRCDICKSNRERYNTFIIRKIETNELIVAGSTCLKKFMPLDVVKAFLEYAVQFEMLRNMLAELESAGENYGNDGEHGGGGRGRDYFAPDEIMFYFCVALLANNGYYISSTKARDTMQSSTAALGLGLLNTLRYGRKEEDIEDAKNTIKKHESKANELSEKILQWARDFDFDEESANNPSMDSYLNNMKVISKLPYLEYKHLGYFASLIALYNRYTKKKEQDAINATKPKSQFVGEIGQKIQLNVKLNGLSSYEGAYGTGYILRFEDENGNSLIWFASNPPEPIVDKKETGEFFQISGTIKDHKVNDYKGNKTNQTVLTRVKPLIDKNKIKVSEVRSIIKDCILEYCKKYGINR